jgi:hypothetical protein
LLALRLRQQQAQPPRALVGDECSCVFDLHL